MNPDRRNMEAMDGRAQVDVKLKNSANSVSVQNTVKKTMSPPASLKHKHALSPSSSGRKRSAPAKYGDLVSYGDSESDDRDRSQVPSIVGSTGGVAPRTKKRNTNLPNSDEDSSYESGIHARPTLEARKRAARSANIGPSSKAGAKAGGASKPKRKTIHPKDQKEATVSFYRKQGVTHRRDLKTKATELEEKDRELEQLRSEKDELQNQLKAMDEEVMRPRSVHKLVRTDDSVVRDELLAFTSECRNWAIEWSHEEPPMENMSAEEKNDLSEVFFGRSLELGGARPMLREGFKELCSDRNGAAILLQTFLTHTIAAQILAKPFRLLLGNGGEDGSRYDYWIVLTKVYQSISEADEAEGSAWRAHTLKLLDRCTKQLDTVLEQDAADNFQGRKNRLCISLAIEICKLGAIQGLFRPRSDEQTKKCHGELSSILQKSFSLFQRLWVQDVDIHTWGASTGDMQRPFRNDDDTMSPHPIVRLNPGDTSLDGQKILVVVQPAILAIELKSLAIQRLEKVWLKALVYISREKQLTRPQHGKAPTGDIAADTTDSYSSEINEQRNGASLESEEGFSKGQAPLSLIQPLDNDTTHVGLEVHTHQASIKDVDAPKTVTPKISTPASQESQAKTLPEMQLGRGGNTIVKEHEEDEPPAKRRRLKGIVDSEEPDVNAAIEQVNRNGAMPDSSSRCSTTNEEIREAKDAEKARKVVEELTQRRDRRLAGQGLTYPE